jgi:hypothetical protein
MIIAVVGGARRQLNDHPSTSPAIGDSKSWMRGLRTVETLAALAAPPDRKPEHEAERDKDRSIHAANDQES